MERSHRGGGTIPGLDKVLKVLNVNKSLGLFPNRYVYQELPRGHLHSVDLWDKRVDIALRLYLYQRSRGVNITFYSEARECESYLFLGWGSLGK